MKLQMTDELTSCNNIISTPIKVTDNKLGKTFFIVRIKPMSINLFNMIICTRTNWNLIKDRRSEEHTSELQSRGQLVCRLLLEKKKNRRYLNQSKTTN